MKVSDYIVDYLVSIGVNTAFGITGSVIAPLLDAFGRTKKVRFITSQHEQASSMAADAYARVSGNLGVAITTSGPGATNLITGICCSWFDSIPTLSITGQVHSQFTKGNLPVKQVGFQETDVVSIVKTITKYAVMIKDPKMIRYELEKAVHIAKSGRPGPVLIDLPADIQIAEVDEKKLISFKEKIKMDTETKESVKEKIQVYLKDLQKAQRPVVLVGGGIIHSKMIKELKELLKTLKVPVVLTWAAIDVLDEEYLLYRGRIGTYGQRGANLTFQNADLLLSLGSRHDGRQTGGLVDSFAREAKRYIIDIDSDELNHQQVKGHVNIHADLRDFIAILKSSLGKNKINKFESWLAKTKEWQKKYPVVLPEYKKAKSRLNGYAFMELLSEILEPNDVIVGDCGGNIVHLAQAFKIKKGQQIITSWAHSPMGYSYAASLGAYFAKKSKTKNVICTIGDGGMQINMQELQTMKAYNIPVKVFILNNETYGIIKQFQDLYLNFRHFVSDLKGGYTHPDFSKVAQAYGIHTEIIKNYSEAKRKIKKVLSYKGPVICDVKTDINTILIPRLGWNTGIEDQYPYLDRKELFSNLYIKPLVNKAAIQNIQP
ncbi:MAG: thiamine pyrophosphate-binding protein [Candidatus Roizmanbacteria bacterium]|nr:MAG: thiamine pyrophosphate-binding protein [Candidatus Roizmanbacteria bacterium]